MNRKKVEKYLVESVGIDVSFRGFDVLVDAILIVATNPTRYRQNFTTELYDKILSLPKYQNNTKPQVLAWITRTVKTATNTRYRDITAKKFIFLALIELGG